MPDYNIIDTSTNKVENRVVWDGDTNVWSPGSGKIGVASTIGSIGDTYNSEGVGIGTTSTDTNCMWIPPS